MSNPTNSAPAPTKTFWEWLFGPVDPDFPAAIVEGPRLYIDDDAVYGSEKQKPDFVKADDENFYGVRQ